MKKILMICLLGLTLAVFSFADNTMVEEPAPFFHVKSGDDQELSLKDLNGKMIVLFYETKETKDKNRGLKDALNKFYDDQPSDIKARIVRLAVINCEGVIFAGAWKSALVENSKKEGMVVYGDWTGEMARAYQMKAHDSNVVIIDDKRIIRYHASGHIDDDKIFAIKDLLKSLATNDK